MEEDSEVLDWGHEEDENQVALRRMSSDQNGQRAYADADDVEDTVSLGEDEDDQGYFYQRPDAIRSAKDTGIALEAPERPLSVQTRDEAMGANDQQSSQYSSAEGERVERSATETPTRSTDSPPRQRAPTNHASPQRSNHNGARLTHALPPKPITVPASYLPLPHPSMVEAVGMASISPGRTTGRDTKKHNGTSGQPGSSPAGADLPQNWEQRHSRKDGQIYYYNRETFKSTRTHPVSSIPSTSSYDGSQTRRRSASSGKIHMTPPDSNTYHSQASRSNRERPHPQPDVDLDGATKALTPDPDGRLSYEDRHYRPGGDISSASVETRTVERTEILSGRLPSKSRYDRSPSPPPRRRRARSISPQPDARGSQIPPKDRDNQSFRGNGRSARDRNVYTNPDSGMQRDLEIVPPEPGYSDRHWAPSPHMPPADFSKNERGSRRPPHRPIDEDVHMFDQRNHSDNRNRPSVRRRESSREPRDREPPRPPDRREKPDEQQSFISTPRYRSPPHPRERDPGRDYGPPQDPGAYTGSAPPNRRDRSSRAEPPPTTTGPSVSVSRPVREASNARPRDFDSLPPSNFDQPRPDRRDDRDHRRDLAQDDNNMPRRPDGYPSVEMTRSSNERPKRFQDDYDQPRPDESSQRRRAPLPPQAKTFLSSSTSGSVYRDPPPHHTLPDRAYKDADPKWPKRGQNAPRDEEPPKQQDRGQNNYHPQQLPPRIDTRMEVDYNGGLKSSAYVSPYEKPRNLDSSRGEYHESSGGPRSGRPPPRESPNSARPISPNVPVQKSENARYERGLPASLPPPPPPPANFDDRRAPDNRQEPRPGWRESRSGNMYPERNQSLRQEYRARPDDDARPTPRGPPAPVSGTNNVPIGTRRPPSSLPPPPTNVPLPAIPNGIPGPPSLPFNPDARPPPSTLIDPAKARDLPADFYERPPHLAASHAPPRWPNTLPEPPHREPLPPAPERTEGPEPVGDKPKRRRESRFSPVEPRQRFDQPLSVTQDGMRGQDRSPNPALPVNPNELVDRRPTPPLISRVPSNLSIAMERSRLSDYGQLSDGRSDSSRTGPSHYSEQRQEPRYSEHRPDPAPSGRFSDRRTPTPDALSFRHDPPVSSLPHPSRMSSESSSLQHRSHTKWGDKSTSEQGDQPFHPERGVHDAPPALSRRLSSERLPRHRKYPPETFALHDTDIHGAENADDAYPPLGLRGQSEEDMPDFKDRRGRLAGDAPVSLLARLSTPVPDPAHDLQPQSLRDRIVPSKRDRDEMMDDRNQRDPSYDGDDGNDSKRPRRRNVKSKRGGRRNVT